MVRVNLVPPRILTDEHLYAERVELEMLLTFIRKYPVGFIPEKYTLGKGHMSFFRDRYLFIKHRQKIIKQEIDKRNNVDYYLPYTWHLDYAPSDEDIELSKQRVIDRLRHPLRKKNKWHYYGTEIQDIEEFIKEHYR
jgi:deoxyribonuclease (pyrimidine dimer)